MILNKLHQIKNAKSLLLQRFSIFFIIILGVIPCFGSQKVYLIHGYGSPKSVMRKINKNLLKELYDTENYEYNSMSVDLDSIGKHLYVTIKNAKVDTVSFVTHSMGALVVRSMLQYSLKDSNFPIIFRIVMLAPPNNGAEIADFYVTFKMLDKIMGPNVQHMVTDSSSYAKKLPIPYKSEVGIIIGIRGKKHGFNPFIDGDNDGYLTPEQTKLGIEKDVAILKSDHTTLTLNNFACILVIEFIETGMFQSKNLRSFH